MLKGRLFAADSVTLSPTTFEFYGWPPICSLLDRVRGTIVQLVARPAMNC